MAMLQIRIVKLGLLAAICAAALTLPSDRAAAQGGDVLIDVNNPRRSLYPMAIPVGVNSDLASARIVTEIASFDLSVSGWFRVLDPQSFLADLDQERLEITPQKWKDVGAFGVIKHRITVTGDKVELTFKLFEVQKGNSSVLSRTYKGSAKELRKLVHQWCNEVVKYYTGEPGFFGSKIAFATKSRRSGKRVMAVGFDGDSPYSLSRNRSINILPAWSPSGGRVAYTSYMRNNPDLYVVGAGGGRPQRISKHYGMNTGATWSPDGRKIALTLSKDGNPEIYVINASTGKIISRLTKNRAIDTSPAWSPNGKEIAFVSDREGGPQIYVMSASGANQHRVSFNGSYNTTPTWAPRKGSRIIAYTTRDPNFDIVTLDLDSKAMVRITQNQGSNEEPSFSPNGRAIAFASTRSHGAGIYIANADGTGKQRRIWKGSATSIDWGPTP